MSESILQAAQAIDAEARFLCHETIYVDQGIAAPTIYRLLGELASSQHRQGQLYTQLAAQLLRSLETHDVYDHEGDPRVTASTAAAELRSAADSAADVGYRLQRAQSVIRLQGYDNGR